MNFRQLEAFVTVVRYHSFSKAADELYLTQPTVSTHISSLEAELGIQLIARSSKVVSPTCAGTVFYEYANGLLQMRDQATDAMQHYPGLLHTTLKVAASSVPAEYLLPKVIAEFSKAYPHVVFSVREANSVQVVDCLFSNECELGFTGTLINQEKCICECIHSDQLVIVTPNSEEYRSLPRDAFPNELLQSAPFLLRMPGSGTRKEADSFLINCGISPSDLHVVAYLDSIESIKQCILQGVGISILSEIAVKPLEEQGLVCVFRNDNRFMHRKLYCIYRSDKTLSPVSELFLKHLKTNGRSESD